ncbi:MAG: AMP-binding protein [Planctomycetota bacterium]
MAFLCPNIPPMLEAHFAVLLAGGVLVSVNTRLAATEVSYILNHSGSRFLFADTELSHMVLPVQAELKTVEKIVPISDAPVENPFPGPDYEAFLAASSDVPVPWVVEDEEETITINYTSGTTGMPKGVMYTHRGAYLNAMGEVIELGINTESVYLWTLPMFHCNGWCFPWALTAVGATHVCLRKFEPGAAWTKIEEHGVTHFNGAPIVLSSLLHHPARPQKLARPMTVTVAAAPPSPTLLKQMKELGARTIHVYGLTETYGPHTVNVPQPQWSELPPEEEAKLRSRQGVCYIMTDPVRVVDENMNDVPRDGATMGEVVMRGNNVMKGYYNDAEATEKAFRGGWFHSGDLAVMHPDGYIQLKDRGKDIIITGGENVSSIEVEQTLYQHPAVLEVAVVGVPDDKWGETPKAFVTLKESFVVTERELIDFCRSRLAHFKCPTKIEFTSLPKTSTGKIQKFVLRNKEWEGREAKIQGA